MIIENLKAIDPDMFLLVTNLSSHQHTAGWIEFGLQFRDL